MKRAKWMALAVAAGALVAEFAISNFQVAEAAPAEKVVICHNTDFGNVTIEVSGNAVAQHIAQHHDHVGECIPGPLG
jgi:hypothetical protein